MLRLASIPKKKFKTFDDFLLNWDRHNGGSESWRADHPGRHPCGECYGLGKVRKYEDRDPIEGYKLAPYYKCTGCRGTGEEDEKSLREAYREHLEDEKALRDAVKEVRSDQAEVLGLLRCVLNSKQMSILRFEEDD